ncbi:hypothetical protein BCR32DRAFT_324999 [Anaeromyces robustus]|uniref:RRM domain-containing protein n=1 Tax=Anaeromyces robustus TaxID=1754192 RepID=A0A1Y1XKP4_9FUNG|nr:hypothetical protein BCR32DRAFT_324999 [Anaeromyces robustus]|eukprot:ORX86337.1 hypothetical protein BCR32DRAFT_324999 [Anaeromyces robustus]
MSHQRSTRVVFVGNIPYDYTEEQLTEVFKEVGPVVSFRLVFDRESGKPRGYGFCEYQDAETAASAVRNLNSYEVGGRELRVDYADNDKDDNHENNRGNNNNNNNNTVNNFQHDDNRKNFNNRTNNNMQNPQQNSNSQNQTQNQQQNQSCIESIQNTVNMLPQRELLELMSQIKNLVETNPVAARNLLMLNPQLSYAIFQALLTLNIVDPNVIQRILQVHMNDSNASMQNQQISQNQNMNMNNQNMNMNNQNMNMNKQQSGQFNGGGDMLQEQQKQLLMQVMSLTPDQLNSLPPDQRENILALKAQIMGSS